MLSKQEMTELDNYASELQGKLKNTEIKSYYNCNNQKGYKFIYNHQPIFYSGVGDYDILRNRLYKGYTVIKNKENK